MTTLANKSIFGYIFRAEFIQYIKFILTPLEQFHKYYQLENIPNFSEDFILKCRQTQSYTFLVFARPETETETENHRQMRK